MTTERPRTCPAVSVAARLENFIDRHSVRLGAWLLRRTRGRVVHLWHRRALVLTTRGRRSGIPRTVVVQHFPEGRDMVVVAANSGMPTHPAWYLNLTDDPRATVEVEGRTVPVRAVPMTRDEAGVWWLRVLQTAPDYARYPARTDRPLPLLRLVPVDEIPEVTARGLRAGARRARRSVRGQGSEPADCAHGRPRADRTRRARRSSGRGAVHRPRGPHLPVAGRRGLRARVHPGRDAVAAAILLPPPAWGDAACVLVALGGAGWVGAVLGGGHRAVAVARVVVGGGLSLALTYLIGHLFGAAVG